MRFVKALPLAIAVWLFSGSAAALSSLRVCASTLDVKLSASGVKFFDDIGRLMRTSASEAGLPAIEVVRMPAARCRLEALAGHVDAVLGSFDTASVADFLLPHKDGVLDPSRRIFSLDVLVLRRRGSLAAWTGSAFQDAGKLGFRRGLLGIQSAAHLYGVPVDDASTSFEQLLRKLAAGRIDLALAFGIELIGVPPAWLDPVEVLEPPFIRMDVYLGFSRHAPEELLRHVEEFWKQIQQRRDRAA